jgi:predicted mannosyl-3-phosphoglycerate phosphatase (HAD superfamily)
MSAEEVAGDSGLSVDFARLAKQREYQETLKLEGTEEEKRLMLEAIEREGLSWTHGGRYYSAMGGCDKGKAVGILLGLFKRESGQICSIGIGDSTNDLPMLAAVDVPVLVQKPGGRWEEVDLPNLHRMEGIGPDGWVKAIDELVRD